MAYSNYSSFLEMVKVPFPKVDMFCEYWGKLLKSLQRMMGQVFVHVCACECWCFSLEPGTVESQCSEGGISDITAARHTEDL